MDNTAFIKAYTQSRNGANEFYRHNLVKYFHYSDGVRDCAQAGCYWLLDLVATEFPTIMRKNGSLRAILKVHVLPSQSCVLQLTTADDQLPIWSCILDYTDMPEGSWFFELGDEDIRVVMILLTEH